MAKAGVLVPKDLSAFKTTRISKKAGGDSAEQSIYTCLGIPRPNFVTRNRGTAFTSNGIEIDSSADVLPTLADAQNRIQTANANKIDPCTEDGVRSSIAGTDFKISSIGFLRIAIKVPGADGVFGYELEIVGISKGQAHQIAVAHIGATVGQTAVELAITQTDIHSMPVAVMDRLLQTLVQRVEAAS